MSVAARLSARTGSPGSRLLGLGAHRPARVVTNDEICEHIDSTDEWIRERSGVVERRFAGEDESVVDMAVSAAEKALAASGVAAGEIGMVLLATVTYLSQTPSAAALVADRLGAHAAAALDISAACAGFCHGVALADDMIRAGNAEHVLVIGVERLSDMVARDDRGAAFLFADGAGAAVIGPSQTTGIGPVVWGADGSQGEAISQDVPWTALRDDPSTPFPHLTMQGQAVFRWAVFQMPAVAEQALAAAGITVDELDVFVPHQANLRIIEAMVRRLHLPERVVVSRDIVTTGNTSAASIPLALTALLEQGEASSGDVALLLGFGAGLSYAAQVVVLP